jgi:acylphosphatase
MGEKPELYARTYTIAGRVQGVGFRYFTAASARSLGVTGYVRNRDDGMVDVYVEGSREQILAMHAQLERGPGFARVMEIHFDETAIAGRAYRSFSTA